MKDSRIAPMLVAMTFDLPEGDFEGYVFDCDGTIVDSMPLHFLAWTASFEHHQAPWKWSDAEFYDNAGVPDREIVAGLNEKYGASIDANSVHDFKLDWYMEHMDQLTAVEPVADIVRQFHAEGRKISIGTGSDLSLVEPSLRHIGMWEYFEIIVTPADVERGKPAPDMFLLAAEKMGVAPEKCLVLEDGQAGIKAADAAGMASVYVPSREWNMAALEK
ncbi:MAG: HAD family phosphatase [Verrucomicrobiota bacterium]